MTVAENLLFESLPQRHGLVNYRETNRRAAALLEEVGLDVAPTTLVVPPRRRADAARSRSPRRSCYRKQAAHSRRADRDPHLEGGRPAVRDPPAAQGARGDDPLHLASPAGDLRDRRPRDRAARRPARRDAAARRTDDPRDRAHDGRAQHRGRARLSRGRRRLGRGAAGRRPAAQREEPRRCRSASARARSSASPASSAAAGPRRRGRSSAPTRRSPARSSSRASASTIASPRDAVRHGLCLMTEDRKGQGLLLGMSCAENITITDLREDLAPRHSGARRRARRGDEAGRRSFASRRRRSTRRCATSPAATSRRW